MEFRRGYAGNINNSDYYILMWKPLFPTIIMKHEIFISILTIYGECFEDFVNTFAQWPYEKSKGNNLKVSGALIVLKRKSLRGFAMDQSWSPDFLKSRHPLKHN